MMINFHCLIRDMIILHKAIALNDHVKSRKVKIRPKSEPWMKGALRKELNNRYRLFQKAKLTQKGSNEWKQYKKSRNRCSNMIKTAKAIFWRTKFGNSKNSKTFWKTVRKFGGGECKGSTIGPLVDKETIITDDNKKSELMNNFFATVGKELAIDLKDSDHTFDCNKHINRVTPTTSDINTDYVSFEKSFTKAVKPGKACGLDKISARDLKINEPASIKWSISCNGFKCKDWKISNQVEVSKHFLHLQKGF